jgi:prepilin-type N-terminal cleavage/methylation domain-containing protein
MLSRIAQYQARVGHMRARSAFTLVEVLVSLFILALVISGVCYGYAEVNRIAVWDSMSQAAQAFAIRGMEAARTAKWNPWVTSTNLSALPGSQDELPAETNGLPSLIQTNVLDIPLKGNPQDNYNYYATNYIFVTQYPGEPPVRQICSQCVWTFPLTGDLFTNTVITLRGPDQ